MVCGKCTKRISHIPSYVKASAAGADLYCQGYVMLARSGGKGAAAPLRGVGCPRPDSSFRAWRGANYIALVICKGGLLVLYLSIIMAEV